MFSLFTRKKPEYQSPNMSVANMSVAPKTTQSVYKPLFSPQTQTTNYFTQPPKTIQGSGMTSNYASNPSNYQPPKVTPPKPVVTPSPVDGQTKAIDDFLATMRNQTNSRVESEQQSAAREQELINKRYELMGQTIRGQIDPLKTAFDRFKGNTEADIVDVEKQGALQKDAQADYFGEANRTAAQARQETGSQARRKFANQGAVDSAGAGSYQEANENIDSEYNRTVAQNAKSLAMKQSEIDMAVGQYVRQAKTLIEKEESDLIQSLKQIEVQFVDNELGKQQASEKAISEARARVYAIQDKLSDIEQQAATQKQNLAVELAKLSKTQFTPEFMATGVPTSQAEYEFMVTNADKMKELGIVGANQSGSNQNKALTMVNNLLGANTKPITGGFRTGNIPMISSWTGSAQTQADYDGLKSLLALAERGQLKGSGQVSDFEAKMLEKAAMAGLNQNLSDDEFRRRLEILKNDLVSGGATANMSSVSNEVAKLRQSGFSDAEIKEYLGG